MTARPVSAELDDARRRNRAWLTGHGLLPSQALHERYDAWALPDLIGFAFPDAAGADLDLLVDILGWYTMFDDHFDGPAGRAPAHAQAVLGPLLAVMGFQRDEHTATPGHQPLTSAWQDLWRRQECDAPPPWRARAAADWRACLQTVLAESAHRHRGTLPSLAEAVRLRRHGSCLYPFMNMLTRTVELPCALAADPAHRRLRAHTADAATSINDLYSLEREERMGEVHNMVLIVQRLRRADREEAIAAVAARVHELLQDSARLADRLAAAHPAARPYLSSLRTLVEGAYRWSATTSRYAVERLPT